MKMKTKSSLLIGILTLAMIFGIFTVVLTPVRADPDTFTVSPSGGDDTGAIQQAFNDAIAAGPGSTVELAAGQFYTNAIFVENFDGTFKGAGKDLTTIDTLKGLYPGELGVVGPVGPNLPPTPHLFAFRGGNVHISDLCFDITPAEPAEEWESEITDLLSIILITGDTNSRIENIKCTGHEGTTEQYPDWHPLFGVKKYNLRCAVIYGFGGTGKHIATDCEFESIWLAFSASLLDKAEVKMTSNSIKGGAIGIIIAENTNSKFEISDNYIEANAYACIWVMQFTPPPCHWLITGNTMKPSILADGISLEDYTGAGALKAVVCNNEIILDTFWGGIWTYGVNRAYIYSNVISGTAMFGYGIGLVLTDRCLILSNKISNYGYKGNGINLVGSNKNLILGNCLTDNGGWGLYVNPAVESKNNCIIGNLFENNAEGNIFDEFKNKYFWNLEQ